MIVITGAAGFIGSNLLSGLNREGYRDVILVDDFTSEGKNTNIENKIFSGCIQRDNFHRWLKDNHRLVQFVFHIGARTDTAELRTTVFDKLNLNYSKKLWNICAEYGLSLIYASSAATYGSGEHGYSDDHEIIRKLRPLNPYGESKNDFDKWVLNQERSPFFWAGMKYFNVYGPNEYHKGRMASVIFHAWNQISNSGKISLFRSHDPLIADGEQKRDFIYVNDVVDVMLFMMHQRKYSGIYNLGTGKARTFKDLALSCFRAMEREVNIEFIDTPADIRNKYQYFTEAEMTKLRQAGYSKPFTAIEEGVNEYINDYLADGSYR
jgi:ADP-L-glycero-D-manno-heptose 6-epimerase